MPLYLTMIGLHLGLGLALKICECMGRGLPHLVVKEGRGVVMRWLAATSTIAKMLLVLCTAC